MAGLRGSIPDHAYANSCWWRRICQVRGRYYSQVDPEVWVDICRTRGYVLARQNPRQVVNYLEEYVVPADEQVFILVGALVWAQRQRH